MLYATILKLANNTRSLMFSNQKSQTQSHYKHVVCTAETSLNSSHQSQLGMINTLVNSNDILRKELESRSQEIEGLELRVKELGSRKCLALV